MTNYQIEMEADKQLCIKTIMEYTPDFLVVEETARLQKLPHFDVQDEMLDILFDTPKTAYINMEDTK